MCKKPYFFFFYGNPRVIFYSESFYIKLTDDDDNFFCGPKGWQLLWGPSGGLAGTVPQHLPLSLSSGTGPREPIRPHQTAFPALLQIDTSVIGLFSLYLYGSPSYSQFKPAVLLGSLRTSSSDTFDIDYSLAANEYFRPLKPLEVPLFGDRYSVSI